MSPICQDKNSPLYLARKAENIAKAKAKYVPTFNKRDLLQRDGNVCVWCGGEMVTGVSPCADHPDNYRAMTIEHLLPQSLGGTDDSDNLALACQSCNSHRQSFPVAEWVRRCPNANITLLVKYGHLPYSYCHQQALANRPEDEPLWTQPQAPVGGKPMSHAQRKRRRKELLSRDGTQCVWCAQEMIRVPSDVRDQKKLAKAITIEHLVPLNEGGVSTLDNIALACHRCNNLRGSIPLDEWLPQAPNPRVDVLARLDIAVALPVS